MTTNKDNRSPHYQTEFDEQIRALTAPKWEKILREHDGNLTHSAESVGIVKSRAYRLTKKFGFMELAKKLREANGQPHTGRPPNWAK